MIRQRLDQIEQKLRAADEIADDLREQLLEKLEELKAELESGQSEPFDPESLFDLLGFAQISAHEALRPQQDPELLKLALDGVALSLEKFEAEHPKLVSAVNSFCITLANMGI